MTTKQPPADTLRLNGLKATIWRNETQNGVMFNTSIVRTYRDKDGNYHDTTTFGQRDLPALGSLVDMAIARVSELSDQERSRNSKAAAKAAEKQNQR